jgi:hypothetical protein
MAEDSDFGERATTGGVFGGGLNIAWGDIGAFYLDHPMAITIAIIVLVILVFSMFFGWIGTATARKEGLRSCMLGNKSALCRQGRDGPGEGLTNSALAQGYGADPNAFCAGAGESTTDPWDYMRDSVASENFSRYASPTDQFDQNAMIAMQH